MCGQFSETARDDGHEVFCLGGHPDPVFISLHSSFHEKLHHLQHPTRLHNTLDAKLTAKKKIPWVSGFLIVFFRGTERTAA